MSPATLGAVLVGTGALTLVVMSLIRWRLGFVAIPGFGRQPFAIVLLVCWSIVAMGALLPSLIRSPTVAVAAAFPAGSGALIAIRGREIAVTRQADPLRGYRNLVVAAHAGVVAALLVLAGTGNS